MAKKFLIDMKQNSFSIKFNIKYFSIAVLLFLVEVFIALYVNDTIIRPYVGDVFVVILLYCLVKSFFNFPVLATAIWVLLFSYLIETLQYFQYVKWLGLEHSNFANVIMGNYFAWNDLIAYTIGIVIVLFVEKILKSTFSKH